MTRPAPVIAGFVAALLLLFGAYLGAYLLRGVRVQVGNTYVGILYESEWEESVFAPAHYRTTLYGKGD